MKNQKWLMLVVALVLMAGTAGSLTWLRANQKLGKPGIKAVAIPGNVMMDIQLPERVLDFTSTNMPEPEIVVNYLPKDTSYAGRLYTATNGLQINNTVILMGADRTSIHKPEYCLPGQGWAIKEKSVVNISVAGPQSYQLPVARWIIGNSYQTPDGRKHEVSGLYVFWFVADGQQTTDNYERMWWLGRDLLRTGILQRWAYVAYFAMCAPGQEDATFEQMKDLIAHSVPEFQMAPAGR
ncbi:MAG: exosortase-associated EpsI family protein [Verrucomicrobiales bacterium]|nr:exosortase-associated EpsI family protein [Verrucomicrobiales bacterium]